LTRHIVVEAFENLSNTNPSPDTGQMNTGALFGALLLIATASSREVSCVHVIVFPSVPVREI
jgi:hypothetical protein